MHKWETFKLRARQYLLTKEWHKADISITYVIWSIPLDQWSIYIPPQLVTVTVLVDRVHLSSADPQNKWQLFP